MTLRRRNQRWEEMDKATLPLSRLIRHYEAFNQTEGKSPKTISWYTDNLLTLRHFFRVAAGQQGMFREMGMDYWLRRTQEVLERVEAG